MRKFATKNQSSQINQNFTFSVQKRAPSYKKSTSPPVGAVVTNIRYAHEDMAMMATTITVIAK